MVAKKTTGRSISMVTRISVGMSVTLVTKATMVTLVAKVVIIFVDLHVKCLLFWPDFK